MSDIIQNDKIKMIIELDNLLELKKGVIDDGSPLSRKQLSLLSAQIKLIKMRIEKYNNEHKSFSWGQDLKL
jgi:hypothetical protein